MYKLEQAKTTSSEENAAFLYLREHFPTVSELAKKLNSPEYRYWDTAKFRIKLPGLKPEQGWFLVRNLFRSDMRESQIKTADGDVFSWQKPIHFDALLHHIDTSLGGSLLVPAKVLSETARKEFIADSLMEEAIASSRLEGANTERKYAKKLLREKMAPKTIGDKMIINNHKAMQLIEEKYQHEELSIESILHLHEILTVGTLESSNDEGRFRCSKDDTVVVMDKMTGDIYHEGLNAKLVHKEMARLVAFANTTTDDKNSFTHPIIKAIMIHFWIGYIHPFMDGNGRLARTLFYWSVIRAGYWGFAYAPISKMIQKSKGQYEKAYIYSEQDNFDLTYFLDYNLRKIDETITYIHQEIDKYRSGKSEIHALLTTKGLNDRQAQLVSYLTEDSGNYTTPTTHSNIYGVSIYTAINDLKELLELKYVKREKVGINTRYSASEMSNELQS
jgi:Fic family protein